MRISRDTELRKRRWSSSRQYIGAYELFNLLIWAIIFVTSAIVVEQDNFNVLALLEAIGMVLSTMIVHWAQGKG